MLSLFTFYCQWLIILFSAAISISLMSFAFDSIKGYVFPLGVAYSYGLYWGIDKLAAGFALMDSLTFITLCFIASTAIFLFLLAFKLNENVPKLKILVNGLILNITIIAATVGKIALG